MYKKYLVNRDFGYPMYIAQSDLGIEVTDQKGEAELWGENDGEIKARIWSMKTGLIFQYEKEC